MAYLDGEQVLSADNLQNQLVVTSMLENPLHSLYLSLHNVYAPRLMGYDAVRTILYHFHHTRFSALASCVWHVDDMGCVT